LFNRLFQDNLGKPALKVKPVWILMKQEMMGLQCTLHFAPLSRQITTPAPHHLIFYRPDALSDMHPTNRVKALKAIKLIKDNN